MPISLAEAARTFGLDDGHMPWIAALRFASPERQFCPENPHGGLRQIKAASEVEARLSPTGQRKKGTSVIGSNRDLLSIRSSLDCEIEALSRLARGAHDLDQLSSRLSMLVRERRALSAALANRHIEAKNEVVDLRRWYSGDGALREILHRIAVIPAARRLRGVSDR